MKRSYQSGDTELPIFFYGKEIEKTPAYGMDTLFVVGCHTQQDIDKALYDINFQNGPEPIKHIFFGANHSFNPSIPDEWRLWEEMIYYFLKKDYLCSLDIPISQVEEFNDSVLCEYDNFIPQIRIPLPYIKLWNYNTMLKIDDIGFNISNPGVWTHSLHKLMDRDHFTEWRQYKNDKVLK